MNGCSSKEGAERAGSGGYLPTLANVGARGCAACWLFRGRRELAVALFPVALLVLERLIRLPSFPQLLRSAPFPFGLSVMRLGLLLPCPFRFGLLPLCSGFIPCPSSFGLSAYCLPFVSFSSFVRSFSHPHLSLSPALHLFPLSCWVLFLFNRIRQAYPLPPFLPPRFGLELGACQGRNRSWAGSRVHSCPPLCSFRSDHSPRFRVAASGHGKALPPVKREGLT